MRVTPESISELQHDEVFVFGSNQAGRHGAGAAFLAAEHFGAVMGIGVGHVGQSYAIPTKDSSIKSLTVATINIYVNEFIDYACDNPDITFLVTRIGCGLAGFKTEDIAPMFSNVPENVILPEDWS